MFRVKNVDGITKYSQFRFRAVSGPHLVRGRPGAIFVTSATPVFTESLGDFDGNPQCILTISFSSLSRNCVFCWSENTFFDHFWTPPGRVCLPLCRPCNFQNRLPVPVLKIRADVRFYVCPKRGRRDDIAFLGCFLEVAETRKIVNSNIIKDVDQTLKISGSENGALKKLPIQL